MRGHITISDQATRLYHAIARMIGEGGQAIHIVWTLDTDDAGHWSLGFSPESDILSADAKVQDYVVAGRCRGIMVVVDGPMPKKQKR